MLVKPVTVSAGNIFVTHFSIPVLYLSLFGIVPIKGNRYADLRILAIALQIPENSHISVAKPRTGDDGLLPAGRQMPTDWHLTSGKFKRRTSGALPTSQQRLKLRANLYAVME